MKLDKLVEIGIPSIETLRKKVFTEEEYEKLSTFDDKFQDWVSDIPTLLCGNTDIDRLKASLKVFPPKSVFDCVVISGLEEETFMYDPYNMISPGYLKTAKSMILENLP